jgi:hypothetical protein
MEQVERSRWRGRGLSLLLGTIGKHFDVLYKSQVPTQSTHIKVYEN